MASSGCSAASRARPLVVESLAGLATAYACFSFIPWMSRFLSLIGA